MGTIMANIYSLLQVFIIAIYAVKWVGVIIPLILLLSYLLVSKSAKAIKETVRLTSTTKSPILSYLGETINGASTIRAFKRTDDFVKGVHTLLNKNILAVQMQTGV